MNTFLHVVTLSSGVILSSLAFAQSGMGSPPMGNSEAMQMSQDMSPKAREQLFRREAHAAYNEAMKACKSMEQVERKGCMSEAKRNLRQDLSSAKEMMRPETSAGAGGVRERNMSGGSNGGGMGAGSGMGMGSSGGTSGAGGMNDMSGAGSTSSGASGGTSQRSSMPEGQPTSSMSSEPATAAEKQQFVQSFSPQARYNLAKREANAAYVEALKECKSLAKTERSGCTKDARATLQQDLAYAKRQMQQDSSGASGTGTSGTTGTNGGGMTGSERK